MYAPPMPLEQPPMVNDRPGVRALRGAAPPMSPQMQRMRDWANSQRAATAANARNGDFIMNPSPGGPTAGVPLPTQLPAGDWRSAAPVKPSAGPSAPPIKPGMLPVKPGMEPQPPGPMDKRRLTGRRG